MAEQDPGESLDLSASRELVRSAAKWFIGGLGAIGAVLVAGSQLSSVGSLDTDSGRFWVAVAGVTVGLLAILWAMSRVVDVLAPGRWSFEDIVAAWADTSRRTRRVLPNDRDAVGTYFRKHPLALGGYKTPEAIQQEYDASDPDREGLDDLVNLMDEMLDKAATVSLQTRFSTLRWQIAAGVLLGAAGIVAFAWAANPADPTQPPPSLRGANLVGADLRGASLRNVDLSHANLTNANLEGADLAGAKTIGVVWSHTTCPDGTNSAIAAGHLPQTCSGHLTPQP